jgi:hypothetical protein
MIRRCPRYPECLVATTVDERRYCPTHGERLVSAEIPCAACGAAVLPDERFCAGCGAAQTDNAQRPSLAAAINRNDDTPTEETCLIYDWVFRRRNGAKARLDQMIIEMNSREPEEIRKTFRAFIWDSATDAHYRDERELRALLLDVALDRVDWDQLVEDYLERERRDAAEDRAE